MISFPLDINSIMEFYWKMSYKLVWWVFIEQNDFFMDTLQLKGRTLIEWGWKCPGISLTGAFLFQFQLCSKSELWIRLTTQALKRPSPLSVKTSRVLIQLIWDKNIPSQVTMLLHNVWIALTFFMWKGFLWPQKHPYRMVIFNRVNRP